MNKIRIPYEVNFTIRRSLINRINHYWPYRQDKAMRENLKKYISALRYMNENASVY